MTTEAIPYFEDEQSKLVPGEPMVERNVVHVIVYDRNTDKVLCLDWSKFGWKTFIVGGIEEGEKYIDSAKREVEEETGYTDLKFIQELGKTKSGFYAAHKKENRIANATGLLFELLSTKQEETKESDTQHHEYVWIPKGEVEEYVNFMSQKYIWKNAVKAI